MWTFSLENESQVVPFCIGFEVCDPFLSRRNVELFFFHDNYVLQILFLFIYSHLFLLVGGYLLYNISHTLTWISHGFTCVPHPDPRSHLPPYPIKYPIGKLTFFVFSFMNLNNCNNQDRYVASPSHLIFLCFVWRISARGTIWASATNFSNTQSSCETGLHFSRARHDSGITWSCKSGLFLPSIYTKHSVGWNLGFSNHYSR